MALIKFHVTNKESIKKIDSILLLLGFQNRIYEQGENFYNEYIYAYNFDVMHFIEMIRDYIRDPEAEITINPPAFNYDEKYSTSEGNCILSFNDISILKEEGNANTSISVVYPDNINQLYPFNMYELIKNNLLILESLYLNEISSILFIGRDYKLYKEIISKKYPTIQIDAIEMNDHYENKSYDCIFINEYFKSYHTDEILKDFENVDIKIISGIMIPEYEEYYYRKFPNAKKIYSHFWASYILGNIDFPLYDTVLGFVN